jgi:hypothetical protein
MRISYPLAVLAGLLALSACGKKPHEEPVDTNEVVNEPENVPAEEMNEPAPVPEANVAKPMENRIAPPEISEEQQMQDDAEATGMTSRLPDNSDAATGVVQGKMQ